eukprot:6422767-Pyramimonas_sp.AAC.1
MPCAEWYTSVDCRRLSTVKLKSKAFLAVDSGLHTHSVDPYSTNRIITFMQNACFSLLLFSGWVHAFVPVVEYDPIRAAAGCAVAALMG